jgi:hypothetical protein
MYLPLGFRKINELKSVLNVWTQLLVTACTQSHYFSVAMTYQFM